MADAPLTKPKIAPWEWRVALLVVVALIAAVNLYFICRFNRDEPVTYASLEDHFKYRLDRRRAGIGHSVLDLESAAENVPGIFAG